MNAIASVPTPDQIAYVVPSDRCFSVSASSANDAAYATVADPDRHDSREPVRRAQRRRPDHLSCDREREQGPPGHASFTTSRLNGRSSPRGGVSSSSA